MSVRSQGRGGGSDASVGCIAGDASIVASLGLGVDLGDGAGDRVDGEPVSVGDPVSVGERWAPPGSRPRVDSIRWNPVDSKASSDAADELRVSAESSPRDPWCEPAR